ncbi:periplasmic chaperone for outer membrane proteins SurA [Fodinibius roseus]|uniref:Periplasmic chaperone for outer membrane proteins SurA n=1 Tax=Fodinibius roseus TaxID=1194090 RepID=A0A1M5CAB4_9BACT|nr:peptidylprolyl isomerase [Fodinibius roseus]SHF51669.1 periplasmic chaperone for outer membrane proteins SurA [Fodinibius roseus]
MNKIYYILVLTLSLGMIPMLVQAQESSGKTVDKIVAVVNDHIILKSDVDQQVRQYILQMQQQQNRQIPFGEDIWYSVLQNIVDRNIMLDQAKRDSVEIPNQQVDQQINRRIQQSIQQLGSEEALEQQMGQSIVQIRADMRENFREQMTVQRLQQQKQQEVQITRPEVKEYFESIPEDSLPTIPEQVSVSQIVLTPPPLEDARQQARNLAEQLRDSVLNHGKTIEELAKRHSDGPSASDGGKLPLMSLDELVAEYSAAAAALEPGEISEVVESSFGFHVIRLNERVGDQIDTNHILISIDEESYDDQAAINRLEELKDSIQTNEDVTFADVARKHSEDPNTAPLGGRLLNPETGERMLALEQMDPALYRIVLLLENEGDISEPKSFQMGQSNNAKRAFRIVRLNKHVEEHVANFEQDYDRIKAVALQAKQQRMINSWIADLRDEMYVEYKIPIPDKYRNMSL